MNSESYVIRRLVLANLPAMMAIEREVSRSPWSASIMRDSLLAAHTQAWGMFLHNGELVAFGVLSVVLDEVELLTMSVAAQYHRQGYGDQLLTFLLNQARQAQGKTIYLEVNVHNRGARQLYQKHGFQPINIRKEYYTVPGSMTKDDAVIMSLTL